MSRDCLSASVHVATINENILSHTGVMGRLGGGSTASPSIHLPSLSANLGSSKKL